MSYVDDLSATARMLDDHVCRVKMENQRVETRKGLRTQPASINQSSTKKALDVFRTQKRRQRIKDDRMVMIMVTTISARARPSGFMGSYSVVNKSLAMAVTRENRVK
jgi:hypothetical protein